MLATGKADGAVAAIAAPASPAPAAPASAAPATAAAAAPTDDAEVDPCSEGLPAVIHLRVFTVESAPLETPTTPSLVVGGSTALRLSRNFAFSDGPRANRLSASVSHGGLSETFTTPSVVGGPTALRLCRNFAPSDGPRANRLSASVSHGGPAALLAQ